MPTPALPSDNRPPGEAAALVNPDEVLVGFWEKNRQTIVAACLIVLAAIVGKGGWDYVSSQKEEATEREYAEATTPERLRTFVEAHPSHMLAGLAELRVADASYQAGQTADALAGYEKAAAVLKTGILAARAQLGLAITKLQSGQTADGEAGLRQLAGDAGLPQSIRAEATYHLASLAADAGRADEVQRLSTQLMQIDPASPWAQQAFALQARLPFPAKAAAPASGAIAFPAAK